MQIKVSVKKLHKDAIIPKYHSSGSVGFDFHSIEDKIIKPNEYVLVKSGLAFAIQKGHELQIRPRSGLALKYGITVLNAPGTIDSDYRGEVGIVLINHSKNDFKINKKDRIAQGVIMNVYLADFEEKDELDTTQRAESGFGSTGV